MLSLEVSRKNSLFSLLLDEVACRLVRHLHAVRARVCQVLALRSETATRHDRFHTIAGDRLP